MRIVLFILLSLYGCHKSPDIEVLKNVASADQQTLITVGEEEYGNSFGPVFFAAWIGPNNSQLNLVQRRKLFEIDAASTMPPPTAIWVSSKSVIIKLPLKRDKLPATDHYGSVRIIYQAQ